MSVEWAIWRDPLDDESFMLGRRVVGHLRACAKLHCDELSDLIGRELFELVETKLITCSSAVGLRVVAELATERECGRALRPIG